MASNIVNTYGAFKPLKRMMAVEQPKPLTDVERRVNDVIGDLTGRKVSDVDRGRLRKAVDAVDAPLTGRAAGDHALGRISRKG